MSLIQIGKSLFPLDRIRLVYYRFISPTEINLEIYIDNIEGVFIVPFKDEIPATCAINIIMDRLTRLTHAHAITIPRKGR